MYNQLDPVLARHLRPVHAPEELWARIHFHRERAESRPIHLTPVLVLALVAVTVAFAAWQWLPRRSDSPRALALQALSRDPDLDLRSDTASEIRHWVKNRTGLDLPLPAETPSMIRMTGVCAVKGGTPTVEVTYRVAGRPAALLVSRAPAHVPSDGKHRRLKCDSVGGARVSSWVMRGQLYTLAYAPAGDARDECLLCHAGAPSQSPALQF